MPTASTETTRATTRSASRKKNTAFQLNAMGAAKTEAKQQAAAVPTHPPFLHLLLLDLLETFHIPCKVIVGFLPPGSQRALLNTTRRLAHLKRQWLYWELTEAQSRIYYEKPAFRARLGALVSHPDQQLALRFFRYANLTDATALADVHSLELSCCQYISNVSSLAGVYNLTLNWCDSITDVCGLGSVHNLTLCCRYITDVSGLAGVHNLTLSNCLLGITDVSGLAGVQNLTFIRLLRA